MEILCPVWFKRKEEIAEGIRWGGNGGTYHPFVFDINAFKEGRK
jgi:hypothetical protein